MAYIPGPLPKHERIDPEIVGYVPLTVNFGDFSDIRERGRLNLNYHWNFGDGSTSAESNPIHIYSRPGRFIVTLNLENEHGYDTKTSIVEVFQSPQPPSEVDFFMKGPGLGRHGGWTDTVYYGQTFRFIDSSSNPIDCYTTGRYWKVIEEGKVIRSLQQRILNIVFQFHVN